jgi:predicted flap endonuclease-1-like 5' DNA nuclease
MTNDQTQGSLALTGILAAGFGAVAFGIALVVGGWDYSPAAGVAVGVAAAAGIFLLVALHRPEPPVAHGAPARETAPAPVRVVEAEVLVAETFVASVSAGTVGVKPAGLSAPRGGQPDDLKIIRGIGPKLEVLCHRLGYYHFDQIAGWTSAEIAWVDDNLEGFRGRVTRDDWVGQAKALMRGDPV